MSSVFTSIPEDKNNLNVNVFDWSHENNLTTRLGMITPIFCQKLPPKSSISIDCRHAFQFMPMVFPIQTTIKARVSFYKMPVRALWKNYQDWISSVNQQHHSQFVPPFTSFSNSWSDEEFDQIWGTKSLADYFGIATTFDGVNSGGTSPVGVAPFESSTTFTLPTMLLEEGFSFSSESMRRDWPAGDGLYSSLMSKINLRATGGTFDVVSGDLTFDFISQNDSTPADYTYLTDVTCQIVQCSVDGDTRTVVSVIPFEDSNITEDTSTGLLTVRWNVDGGETTITDLPVVGYEYYVQLFNFGIRNASANNPYALNGVVGALVLNTSSDTPDAPAAYSKLTCPWYNESTGQGEKLSAYPWRIYDAVYNTFIRNIRNNPLYDINNPTLPLYNKVTQLYDIADGISDFSYGVGGAFRTKDQMLEYAMPRYANWEYDMFTTAVQSPQEGVAPLVGLTTYATTTQLADGTEQISLNQYVTDEDGKRYQVNMVTDEEGIQSVSYTEVQQVNGTPITSMYQAVSEGISIADLRNVNAYTRYLEMNQRRGYRYKDIVEGRFDVKVRFDELLMPEFIGGYTRIVNVSPVTQTVQTVESGTTYDGSLGSKAGDGFVFGESDNRITTYCDETSIILGVISFTPKPVYTQTTPKWLFDRDVLDEWNPEFNNLGFQPLLNKEVAAIQYYNNDRNEMNSAFGYQRPWYHLISMYDTAHGDFRGNLRNFLMHRVFDGAPRLTREFLLVHPDQVNDVFNVQEDTDKIFGQVGFDIKVKLGVNRNAVPHLE